MASDLLERLKVLAGFREKAERTLDDPGLIQAFADVRGAALETFQNSAPMQYEERENAYWMLRALDGLEIALQNRIAAHELESQMAQKTSERNTEHALRRVS